MPLYDYFCINCQAEDTRVAGFDDELVTCHRCGGVMVRRTDHFMADPSPPPIPQNGEAT